MRTLVLFLCCWLWSAGCSAAATDLDVSIAALIDHYPSVQLGRMGFEFVDVESGHVIAQRDASHFFTPASNTKLYTTALGLARLGPEYRFHTQLLTTGAWQPGQLSISDLQIVGGGDPNLSGRSFPYASDQAESDRLAAVKQLVNQLAAKGIRRVSGNVIGVAARYPGSLYPDGWTVDDTQWGYGAPVSALSVNDSALELILRPTEPGELADVQFSPALPHFIVQNTVVTDNGEAAHVEVSRMPGTNELVISGTLGSQVAAWRQELGVEDPALFAAEAFVSALRERGVEVTGEAQSEYSATSPGTLLCERVSLPLGETLQAINKTSQNLHAEMLLREVGFVKTGLGTLANGLGERNAFLAEIGLPQGAIGPALDDGSGLARQNLTTPDATVALLRYLWTRPERDVWLRTFPVGDLDGSLRNRFRCVAGARHVLGKTGSLSHVNALSGYIETDHHHSLAFSIMVNGTAGRESDVRDFIDKLCALFLTL